MEQATPRTLPGAVVPPPPLSGPAGGAGDRPHAFLRDDAQGSAPEKKQAVRARTARGTPEGRRLLCAACRHVIAHTGEEIRVQGSHRHTFANPHGYVFRIGCFRAAAGCRTASAASEEFSWFPGYAWRIQVCGNCYAHLGWEFRSARDGFYGLILERLEEEPEGGTGQDP